MAYQSTNAVVPLPDFHILVRYKDGERRIFDVTPLLGKGVFRELVDPAVFNSVRAAFDTIEWSNGADISPELLNSQSRPAPDLVTLGATH